jgi:branched-chain amino acid transport system ATP-binding protein
MLEVINLSSGYGDIKVLKEINFSVEKGNIALILSLNGGGKSTLLKTLGGLILPSEGRILYDGIDITHASPRQRVNYGILLLPEWGIVPNLTIKENMILSASSRKGTAERNVLDTLRNFPELASRYENKASSLSGGQRKLLIMAMAMISGADMLLLDEPSSGVSPIYVDKIMESINIMKEGGKSFIIAEQNPSFTDIADYLMVMDLGRIQVQGKPKEIIKNIEIKNRFFSL